MENLLNNWEDLCKRCGQCCFEKWIDEDGTILPTSIPCRFLDIVTRECKVYHKRFEVDEGCVKLTPEKVKVIQWLPEDCAYVEWARGKRD
jgi:uncharacterized protein